MEIFTIYTRPNCKWCKKALELLLYTQFDRPQMAISVVEVTDPYLPLLKSNHPTVPQIFNGDTFIGGHEELQAYLEKLNG